MSLILNIDTATETAHVSIARDGEILKDMFNEEQKNHGSFLQPAIKKISQELGITLNEIDAVAVTEGPGSYTGLRIGMASAKGLCYALNKPLITIGTLDVMANSARIDMQDQQIDAATLFCPMIDARRMEVFTALFDISLKTIQHPSAVILDMGLFRDFLNAHPIIFSGNGSKKWQNLTQQKNAFFSKINIISRGMSELSSKKLIKKAFVDIAYCQPLYIKEFYIKS